jgi:multidrug efflux pump subunit AcrB
VLIAIGIIVDDAIVVSENIQQYIEKGFAPKEAAFLGTKEMAKPVTIASITTLFSFIPLLMLSGTLGEIIRLIPIAFSALIIASLIESFVFLPIHATHTLSKESKTLSWEKMNHLYAKSLAYLIRYQKSFLLLFFIIVPLLIYVSVSISKFHMFERFDSKNVNITFKADPTATLQDSLRIVQTIEQDLLHEKERLFIKHVSSTAGYRRSPTGGFEMFPYVGYISIELEDKAASNFFDAYITPLLSPYKSDAKKTRTLSSQEISKEIRTLLKEKQYIQKLHLKNLMVLEEGMRNTKADIMIGVVSDDYKKAMEAIRSIEDALGTLDGIKHYGNTIKLGQKEIKLKVNAYGEALGVTEEYIGAYISNLYLSKKIGTIFDEKELVDVKIKSNNYQDDLESFKNLAIPLSNGMLVKLREICFFEAIESLEKLEKDDGETTFYVYASVDQAKTTATEVLEQLQGVLQEVKSQGLKLKFKGEREQKETLETEMVLASLLALILIFISILYLFNSIRETLIVMSVIPFSLLGVYVGHFIMGLSISLPSLIGALGLAGVIVNDGIIMMATLNKSQAKAEILLLAPKRLRPIVLTSVTTLIGLSSLIFFSSGQAVTFQPLAVSVGFGLFWGTLLNLFYLPLFYNFVTKKV